MKRKRKYKPKRENDPRRKRKEKPGQAPDAPGELANSQPTTKQGKTNGD